VNRRKLVLLLFAFALTASVAFLLGLYGAHGNERDADASADLAADSAPDAAHVSPPPRLLLDTSRVQLLPDAGLRLAPIAPPSASAER
jgi:hypothetical protein